MLAQIDSYARREIWEAHEAELLKIVTYTKSLGLDLTVVVFPHLRDVRGSAVITSQVAEFFQKQFVHVVNLESLLEDRDPVSLAVNSLDAPERGVEQRGRGAPNQ